MVEDWIIITKQMYSSIGFNIKTSMRGLMYGVKVSNSKTDKLVLFYQIVLTPETDLKKLLENFFKELYIRLLPVEIGSIKC